MKLCQGSAEECTHDIINCSRVLFLLECELTSFHRSCKAALTTSMEKGSNPVATKPLTRPTRLASKPVFFFSSLLALLIFYNFVPQCHHAVQSFFTLESWADPSPRVELKQGTFIGTHLDNENHPVPVEAFLGIAYALPPTGERRFARAVPMPESREVFPATDYSLRWARLSRAD